MQSSAKRYRQLTQVSAANAPILRDLRGQLPREPPAGPDRYIPTCLHDTRLHDPLGGHGYLLRLRTVPAIHAFLRRCVRTRIRGTSRGMTNLYVAACVESVSPELIVGSHSIGRSSPSIALDVHSPVGSRTALWRQRCQTCRLSRSFGPGGRCVLRQSCSRPR